MPPLYRGIFSALGSHLAWAACARMRACAKFASQITGADKSQDEKVACQGHCSASIAVSCRDKISGMWL